MIGDGGDLLHFEGGRMQNEREPAHRPRRQLRWPAGAKGVKLRPSASTQNGGIHMQAGNLAYGKKQETQRSLSGGA